MMSGDQMKIQKQSKSLFIKFVVVTFVLYWIWIFFGNVLWFEESVGWQLAWRRDLWVTPQERFVSTWFDNGNREGWVPLSVTILVYSMKFIAIAVLAWVIKRKTLSHFSRT